MSRPSGEAKGLGKTIQQARLAHGWSQIELGKRAQLSRPTIARVERGDQGSMRTISKLAQALDLKLNLQARTREDS